MTAQINDTVLYEGVKYALAGIDGTGLLEPDQHGLRLVALSTACWRGHYVHYDVTRDALTLARVVVGLHETQAQAAMAGHGPPLLGVMPRYSERWNEFIYEGFEAVIPFTGGMLLGAEFIDDLYVHMGFHPAWKYRDVRELIFDQGRLVEAVDQSGRMAEFRAEMSTRPLEPTDPDDRQALSDWVERCFSRTYRR